MANRINTFLVKRSSTPGKVPSAGQLLLGEIALNTADAKLYTSGTTAGSILPIGWDRVSRTGDTMTGTLYTPAISATTILVNGLTATTISATSINKVDYIIFNTGTTSAATVPGTVYFDNTEKALSYNTSINQGVTVNLGQQQYLRVFNNSGTDIAKGKALEILSAYSGLPSVTLALNKKSGFNIVGLSAEIIPNNKEGVVITNGIISNISLTGISIGDLIYASDSIPGNLASASDYFAFPLTARTNSVGYVVQTGTTTGKIFVNIQNENNILSFTDLQRNVLEGNALSTGVFSFSGITLTAGNTFTIGPAQGWVVDNTSDFLRPDAIYVNYSGQTGLTTPYMTSYTETYILLTTAATINLLYYFPTPQQRRQGIYLGKIGHGNKTSLINAFNEPDSDISPLSQLRDVFTPIKLINSGVVASANTGMTFNTSTGTLYGLGINFVSDVLNPNSLYIAPNSPVTFQYRTQSGGTDTNRTTIIPGNYDLNGVITTISSPAKQATNQRIYLLQNGQFRMQYGQTVYLDLTTAVAAAQTETFTTFSNFKDNAILVGILSTRSDTTDLNDPLYSQFLFVSKFGELGGGTGGLSTTTLQQAYNNSPTPEIITNITLGALSIQNGTGNADNITKLLEGANTAGNITSFIRADGYISGTTLQTNGAYINNNGITATTISATSITANNISGTTNYVSKFTAANSLGNSLIYDNGTNVGVGTTSPGALFHVNGSLIAGASTTSGLFFNTANDTLNISNVRAIERSGASLFFGNANTNLQLRTSSATRLYINSTGNVGIGTTTPNVKLHVSGDTLIQGNLTVTGNTQSLFSGNSSVELIKIIQNGSGDAFVVQDIANGDSSHFVINASGNTAIGLVQPLGNDKLTVSGDTSIYGAFKASTVSATTYLNLPTDIRVTGGTFSTGTATFRNNTGGTFTVTGFGSVTSVAALTLGTSGTDLSSTVANGTTTPVITLNVPDASATARGVITSGVQTIGGVKTFNSQINGTVGSFSQSAAATTLYGYNGGVGGIGVEAGAGNGNAGYFVNNSTTYPVVKILGLSNTRLLEGRNTSDVITFAVTSAGAVSGSSFIRTGGSSTQFLKADGSVDSTIYSSAFTGGTVPGATNFTGGLTANTISATTINAINIPGFVTIGSAQSISGLKTFTTVNRTTFENADSLQAIFQNGTSVLQIGASSNTARLTSNGSLDIITNYPTNNNARISINSAGDVGIGTTSPYSKFTTYGALSTSTSQISIVNSEGGHTILRTGISSLTNSGFSLISADIGGTNQNTRLVVSSTGNVGIGTITPNAKLHVSGNTIIQGNLTVTGSTQSLFSGNSSVELVKIIQNGSGDAFVVQDIANGDSSHFVINASGNTAIGLTQPLGTDKLTVSGDTSIYGSFKATTISATTYLNLPAFSGGTITSATNFTGGLSATTISATSITANNISGTTNYVSKFTGANSLGNSLIYDNGTNVGIGTTSPSTKLDVTGVIRSVNQDPTGVGGITAKLLSYAPSPYGLVFRAYPAGQHSIQNQREAVDAEVYPLLLQPNGSNVGIGTITPVTTLDVTGNARITGGLTATTISATTYLNLPLSATTNTFVTGGTYSAGTAAFTNNSGGTFNVTGFVTVPANNTEVLISDGAGGITSSGSLTFDGNFLLADASIVAGRLSNLTTTYAVTDGVSSILSSLNGWNNKYASGEILSDEISAEVINAGQLVVMSSNRQWKLASAASASEKSINLLGVSLSSTLGSGENINVLLNGFVSEIDVNNLGATEGTPLYMSTSGGTISDTAPANTGEVVRVIGHTFWNTSDQSNGLFIMRFNPDNVWIEL